MKNVARQISVSDEVYAELSRLKGTRSFSEVIKSTFFGGKSKSEVEKSRAANAWLRARMKKGYTLGKIIGTRDDWHAR